MASLIYNSAFTNAFKGNIDFDTDTFKCMLTTSSYTPNKDAHSKRSSVTNESSGTGYTSGGATCAVTVTQDDATDQINVTLGAVSWPNATISARYAVYYKSRGGASTEDELIAVVDFGSDVSSTNGTFSVSASTLRIQN